MSIVSYMRSSEQQRSPYSPWVYPPWADAIGPLFALLIAASRWASSLASIDPHHMTGLGLLSVLPISVYGAVAILTISFCIAVQQPRTPTLVLGLHIAIFIAIIHGTPALVYGTLRYSWAWKHIGIVDYILRFGTVDPTIRVLKVYHNWPGFFTLSAFITEAAGFKSPLSFAAWSPVFFNLLDFGALILLYRPLTVDRRLRWQSIWFFFLANWVGQDYFSPQALNYFLHLVILAICLTWFRTITPPTTTALKRWLRFDWLIQPVNNLYQNALRHEVAPLEVAPRQQAILLVLIILIYSVIASSHQLTPFMTIMALAGLVVIQRCHARLLPVLLFGIAVIWLASGAITFVQEQFATLFNTFGSVTKNIDANLINLNQTNWAQRVVAVMGRSMTMIVLYIALIGGIRLLQAKHWDLAVIALAGAPFLMLAGNGYGGEILFRVYFFALPFLAFFGAAVIYPSPKAGQRWWTIVLNIVVSGALLVGFGFAYYGKDQMYYFTQQEVDAAEFLYNTAPPGALLIEGSRNYPSLFRHYEYFTNVAISREPKESLQRILAQPAETMARWMRNKKYSAAYLLITRSQKADINLLPQSMPVGSLEKIEATLAQSPYFRTVYANSDARVFALAEPGAATSSTPQAESTNLADADDHSASSRRSSPTQHKVEPTEGTTP